eukprot:CAMPEP_0184094452 /NCGR_PEP_ID=MMETSP0974-20121125/9269_1 /TAXON_ID=483370 /ORGANISM="non described non described, Strain CCMP2097" /LENGTH=246 /DNA_ID=CAMNT_0026397239 /DNA_START=189 /DNA_END=929 /DNA_ORIENTATION=+
MKRPHGVVCDAATERSPTAERSERSERAPCGIFRAPPLAADTSDAAKAARAAAQTQSPATPGGFVREGGKRLEGSTAATLSNGDKNGAAITVPLPNGWSTSVDATKQRRFFVNAKTRHAQWEFPLFGADDFPPQPAKVYAAAFESAAVTQPPVCYQRAIAQFLAKEPWQLTIPAAGFVAAVLQHHDDGWTTVRLDGIEGCVPSSYLGDVVSTTLPESPALAADVLRCEAETAALRESAPLRERKVG